MTTLEAGLTEQRQKQPFRGWWMVLWFTIIRAVTAPGQTMGVSAFIDPMIDSLDVSRSAISTTYLLGTLSGAAVLPALGRWIDRSGVRRSALVVGAAFACVVAATATVQNLVMLTVAFVGLRSLGQGALTLVGATGVTLWFDRKRGLALAVSATASISILSFTPLGFGALIDATGWRWAWLVLGVGVAAIVLPVAFFGLVDRPEDIGQFPDGVAPEDRAFGAQSASLTVGEAIRTPSFWVLGALSALMAGLVTGLIFHNVDILGAQGLTEDEAAAIFVPQVAGSAVFGFVVGWLTDRTAPRFLMVFGALGTMTSALLAVAVSPGLAAILYGLVTGISMGTISALAGALYPKWYGTAHVAAIKGAATSIMVAASAAGPLVLSVGNDLSGSYKPVLFAGAIVSLLVAAAAAVVPLPEAGA